jgi:flavin-dependent dehydrogenase
LTASDVDVAVIGAGLAGIAAAIELARLGLSVHLFEADTLPKHRVCGEYVSLEVAPFLQRLGLDVAALGAKQLKRFELSSQRGRRFTCELTLGGFGLSRFRLDHTLLELASKVGVSIHQKSPVVDITWDSDHHRLVTPNGEWRCRMVLGCFGKRSKLDYTLQRPHAKRRSDYVGVKRHFRGPFPQDLVGLHVIPGGYCGISAVEDDVVNVCYMTSATALKANGSVAHFEARGLRRNPSLGEYLAQLSPALDRPLVISQIDFGSKDSVHHHILMLGDAAGAVHPLAGSGMAIALRTAATVTPLVTQFFRGELTRSELEGRHRRTVQSEFGTRRKVSKGLQHCFESETWSEVMCRAAVTFPALARLVIRSTHGSKF